MKIEFHNMTEYFFLSHIVPCLAIASIVVLWWFHFLGWMDGLLDG